MKLNEQLGYYLPSFFLLNINTDKEINSLNDPNVERTLVHELVHFLQDICTTYGLINICHTVDIIKDQNHILRSKLQPIEVPLNGVDYSERTMINKDLFSIYIGDDGRKYTPFPKNIKATSISINPERIEHINFEINYIEIDFAFTENDNNKKTFHFGSYSLLESMANLIEKEIYGENSAQKSFPYDTAKLIAEHIYPSISDNNIAIAELCEASLMTYHPADAFIKTLHQMKKEKFIYANLNDAYDFVLKFNKLDSVNGTSNGIMDEYLNAINLAIGQLESLFTAKPLSDDTWAKDTILAAYQYKKDNNSIVSAIFGRKHFRDSFIDIINKIGFPMACNNKGQYWQQNNKEYYTNVLYLAVLTFNELMTNGRTECKLIEYCKDALLPIDDLCKSSPWKKDHLLNRECRFSGIWRMWGLEGIQLKI